MSGSDGGVDAIGAATAGWAEPEIVPPAYGPANFPYDFFAATYDVAGSFLLSQPFALGSDDLDAPGFGAFVTVEGVLTVASGGTIDGSTGVNSIIQGTGTVINAGEVLSIGGKAGAFPNSLLTIGGDTRSDLLFRNTGSVVVGGNFGVQGMPTGTGAIVITAAIDPASTGTYVVESGGTLEIARDANQSETFDFTPLAGLGPYVPPQGGTLIIDNPGSSFTDAIIDFDPARTVTTGLFTGETIPTGTIILRGIGPVAHADLDTATHVVTAYGDNGTRDPIYSFTNFDRPLTPEGAGVSEASRATASDPTVDLTGLLIGTDCIPCLAAGTMMATRRGQIAVEAVRPGDEMEVLTGSFAPVVWVGRRRVDLDFVAADSLARPICIAAHAFADGTPRRDLYLSGDHAVFSDGVLIPARALLNGSTIRADTAARAVDYFHVELETHDVIRAEGLAVESWLDTGNRDRFDNADDVAGSGRPPHQGPALGGRSYAADGYALLLDRGNIVDDVRSALAARAAAMGHTVRREMVTYVFQTGVLRLDLPAEAVSIRLTSDSGQRGLDLRRLGILIGGLRLDGAVLPLTGVHIERGFHAIEQHGSRWVRWTDGEAVLQFAAASGRQLEIDVLSLVPVALGHSNEAPQ